MSNITAIVNIYKRPHVLESQIKAILAQTIKPDTIFIWNNGNNTIDLTEYKKNPYFRVFDNNHNFGVWSRFLLSLFAPTEYVCIFDDDTIPGIRWFENCMSSMSKQEALYGTIGVIFKDEDKYLHYKRYGWDGSCTKSTPVDIVGHSWFFKKSWISYFTREQVDIYKYISNGEDIHFSRMLQKYGNIPTLVPPHPPGEIELYGSIPKTAWQYGADGRSETGANYNIDKMYNENIAAGFRRLKDRQNVTSTKDFAMFIEFVQKNTPFAIIRPADGEYKVLQNTTLTNVDGWTFKTGGKLSTDLNDAIQLAKNKCCFIGIPCTCCNRDMAQWYVNNFDLNPLYTTFANIFVNKNWKSWINFLQTTKIPFTYVGCGNEKVEIFNVVERINIDPFLVNKYDDSGEAYIISILDKIKTDYGKIFMFACGPISKIIISRAWAIHPHNIYIDCGSSLDLFFKGSTNRHYTGSDELSILECRFTPDLIKL